MLRRPNTSDFRHGRIGVKRTVRTLLSPEQLNHALSRESARVDRNGDGAMSLVLFRVSARRRNSAAAVRLARAILKRIRVTDDVGWFDDQHLGLLLPDTTPAGAWRLARSISDAVAARVPRPMCTMYTYGEQSSTEENPAIVRTDELAEPIEQPMPVKVAS